MDQEQAISVTYAHLVIPAFNHSHVLPPYEGERMSSASSSPYLVGASELVQRFATSTERCVILDGLLRYRAELRALGFVQGFQWLDGSFTENIEARESRPPKDVDLVTFSHRPAGMDDAAIKNLLATRPDLFDQERCKHQFHCDTNIVSLSTRPEWLVTQSRYWYGLYSHRRGDALWKGMLQLPLDSDDTVARSILAPLLTQGDADAGPT